MIVDQLGVTVTVSVQDARRLIGLSGGEKDSRGGWSRRGQHYWLLADALADALAVVSETQGVEPDTAARSGDITRDLDGRWCVLFDGVVAAHGLRSRKAAARVAGDLDLLEELVATGP